MCTDQAIAELLEHACPSIQYRIHSEILGQSASSQKMVDLQNQILQDPNVKEVIEWQQPDGWLAWNFHGAKSIEAGIRILCEKGVRRHHPVLAQALQALDRYPDRLERGIGKVGKILDEQGFGGSQMIRAAVFAYAGIEHKACVTEQVNAALAGFKSVQAVNSVEDLAEEYQDKLVFKPDARWPSIYHLRLLAFTHGWRTAENRKMITEAITRLVKLSPLPGISVRHKSQVIAPASFCLHDFNPKLESMDAAHWMMWFHRMECLARLGVVNSIPALRRQVNVLAHMLDTEGRFTRKIAHPYFTKWGAYTGLMLETNWRKPERRIYDLTFRSLLILNLVEGTAV